jgi:hypothetical protein
MIEAALFVGAAFLALRVVATGGSPQLAPGE